MQAHSAFSAKDHRVPAGPAGNIEFVGTNLDDSPLALVENNNNNNIQPPQCQDGVCSLGNWRPAQANKQ